MLVGIDLTHLAARRDGAALRLAARAAEQLGYASLWIEGREARALEALRVAAEETDAIPLGLGVVVAPGASPAALADAVSGVVAVASRLAVAVDAGPGELDAHLDALGPVAAALVAGADPAALEVAARRSGWSPAGLSPPRLQLGWAGIRAAGGRGRFVPRAVVHLLDEPAGPLRPDWCGSSAEVAADLADVARAGAGEVVIGLAGAPGVDASLSRWAALAEAVEAAGAAEAQRAQTSEGAPLRAMRSAIPTAP